MQQSRILPTPERARHAVLEAQEIMAENDDGHLETKAVVIRVKNQRWVDEYLRRREITSEQHEAAMRLSRVFERAGLAGRPSAIDLLRSGHSSAFTYGMAANEIQAAARLSYRKALYMLGTHEAVIRRVACEDMPVIAVQYKRGRAYMAARSYAMRDLCAGLDVLVKFFGMEN